MAKELRNPNCQDCGLYKTTKWICLMGQGPIPCKIMIVGEAPGAHEEKIHRPFMGKAGKLLERWLKESGISRNEVYITNVVHCRPPENRTPTRGEIKSCKKYLLEEIKLVKPSHILLLGNTALQGALGRSGITKYRGKIFQKEGISYLATFHPAAGLRQPAHIPVIQTDINRFSGMVRGSLKTPDKFRWKTVLTLNDLKQCLRDISRSNQASFDLETSGLNPLGEGATIYCLGIGTSHTCWVIPFNYPESPFRSSTVAKRIYGALLQSLSQVETVIAHNGKFDNKWLRVHFGDRFPLTFDTMLASYVLDENSPHGLKYLASLYFDAPEYEIPQPVIPEEIPLKTLARYCALDVYYTLKLYHTLKGELEKDSRVNRVFNSLLVPASELFEGVELNGVYVNTGQMEQTKSYLMGQITQLEDELTQLAGKKINWNSPQQVAQILYGELKLPIVALTPSGKPSTSSEEVLPYLQSIHPIIAILLKYRESVKLAQFIASWKDKIIPKTRRMHPTFKLHGTVTGRLSCQDPNLQQVPRDPELRSLITAPRGWVLVEADYSQVELRITACLSRDEAMRRVFQAGGDIHTRTAMAITGLPEDKINKDMRKKAKAVNFGFVYGMGSSKFQSYAKTKYGVDLTEEEAQGFRQRFFELYPELLEWHDRQRQFLRAHGYVRTPLGRKRNLPGIDSSDRGIRAEAERQSINSPVQGAASDLNLFSAIRISREFPDQVRIIATVHDAVLMEIKEDKVGEIIPQIKSLMEDREVIAETFGWDIPVPIEVEIKLGAWGKGRVIERGE